VATSTTTKLCRWFPNLPSFLPVALAALRRCSLNAAEVLAKGQRGWPDCPETDAPPLAEARDESAEAEPFAETEASGFGTWLRTRCREAVALVCVEGLSYRDAAETLAVPIGTLTSRLARGRETLQAILGGAA
jgi:DNA-directed RNA polymerase specialized sigma24 family protein